MRLSPFCLPRSSLSYQSNSSYLELLQLDGNIKGKDTFLPKKIKTPNTVRLIWESPQMLLDTWTKWVHHALTHVHVGKEEKGWSTGDQKDVFSQGSRDGDGYSKGCSEDRAEKCWKLTDQDGQQLRKQVTAACWTLSLSSSLLISHLFQGCQDSPSQPLYPILAYSVFRCWGVFLRKKSIELTCWLQTVAQSWFLAAASCSLSLCLPCLVKKNPSFGKELFNALGCSEKE